MDAAQIMRSTSERQATADQAAEARNRAEELRERAAALLRIAAGRRST
jgi:hypothetical protein